MLILEIALGIVLGYIILTNLELGIGLIAIGSIIYFISQSEMLQGISIAILAICFIIYLFNKFIECLNKRLPIKFRAYCKLFCNKLFSGLGKINNATPDLSFGIGFTICFFIILLILSSAYFMSID